VVSYFFFFSYQTRVIILYWYQRRNTTCNNQYICVYFSDINEQYFNVVIQIVRLLFLYKSYIDQLQNDRFLSIIQHYLQRCQTWNRTGRSFFKDFHGVNGQEIWTWKFFTDKIPIVFEIRASYRFVWIYYAQEKSAKFYKLMSV
jgi:hypothetical protein